jgi:hypothetical protein
MDDQQALRIVSALANGTNPVTGEIFAPDSPYQSPDVIRALFVAARALESRAAPAERASMPTASKPALQGRHPTSGNAGKPWSVEEDRELLAAFDAGKSLDEIAQSHGRTQGGVRARLEKHGRLEPSPATRWPAKTSSRNESVRDAMR